MALAIAPGTMKKAHWFGLAALCVFFGCAAAQNEDSDSQGGAVSAGTVESGCSAPTGSAIVTLNNKVLSAAATNADFEGNPQTCSVNVQTIKVLGLPSAIQTKVNAKLAAVTSGPDFSVKDCTDGFDISGATSVSYNKDGLLSVTTSLDSYYQGAAHPNTYQTYSSFDLATGELLQLGDIVETSAKDLVKAEALKSVNRSHMEAEDKATMAEALGFTFSRPITSISDFTITEKGLRFNPGNNLPHAMAALAPANGYLVSWKSIRAQIKDTPATAAIRALADRAN